TPPPPAPAPTTCVSVPSCTDPWWCRMAELVERDPVAHLDARGRSLVGREVGRRGFLKCASWSGAAVVWTVSGGLVSACGAAASQLGAGSTSGRTRDLFFVQLSD